MYWISGLHFTVLDVFFSNAFEIQRSQYLIYYSVFL